MIPKLNGEGSMHETKEAIDSTEIAAALEDGGKKAENRKVFKFVEKSRVVITTENWEEENPQIEREYSFEEKRRIKALVDDERYDTWEKDNRLWESGLVPKNFFTMLEKFKSRRLTEEEERQKHSYLENRDKARLGLNTEPYNPNGPGWELAYYAGPDNLLETFRQIALSGPVPAPWEREEEEERRRQTVALTTPSKQGTTVTSPYVISTEEEREKLLAQGRCLIGSYLTPYCKCDGRKITSSEEEYSLEYLPIWHSYRRQCRQSHCFDIDDDPGTPSGVVIFGASVEPLGPSQGFNGKAELLMELANRAIHEYNMKECNVFKYKVRKIEKVNCSLSMYHQYWMTVKTLNLTLGTPIETFQIHAGISCYGDDKKIYCCRLKEEAIVGLPSCDFCFGLLTKGHHGKKGREYVCYLTD